MKKLMLSTAIAFAATWGLTAPVNAADDVLIGLITKTNNNPFFVKMREGAEAKAKELGVELQAYAGDYDGDNETQVSAVENLISSGAKGILILANDTKAIVPTIKRARDAGILVIALDTPLEPIEAADSTFATDNFEAGRLIGAWAAATLGDEGTKNARVALLDAHESQPTVDVLRDQGFMAGFGFDIKNPDRRGDEEDDRIVGHQVTGGSEEGGLTAMETLLQRDYNVNVVYTINEPAAAGAWQALKSAGKSADDILLTSVDGGCPGVENVRDGVIDATSMQFPLLMASLGVEAVVEYAKTGKLPENSDGLDFYNTGVQLVTDAPVKGIASISSEEALKLCWG
ncbi:MULTISPECIES: sugar ABC transporter substrate-binding protein [unclassified Lentilitoribacter]|uniref:sugar ABC transporter substrate-binding protein n=1 Tax=unclassified Lentilitoribacter TaxID=2647570 RepID=UPI0013A6CB44|nr:sugar ABC transporter substrate-binding protein [Lentilitoribacter sp. Alg239-R112]